jgi:hypothetical protein
MQFEFATKPVSCPCCGSIKIATIQYGTPEYLKTRVYYLNTFIDFQLHPDIVKKIELGEIELGGCIYSSKFPVWRCKDCRVGIYKSNELKDKEHS